MLKGHHTNGKRGGDAKIYAEDAKHTIERNIITTSIPKAKNSEMVKNRCHAGSKA